MQLLVILMQTGEKYRSLKNPFSRSLPATFANSRSAIIFSSDLLTLDLSTKHYLCTNLIVTTPVQKANIAPFNNTEVFTVNCKT